MSAWLSSSLLLASMGMEVATTGEALSHPEYHTYVLVTFGVVLATLLGYGLWLQRSIAREEAEWEASGWDAARVEEEGHD